MLLLTSTSDKLQVVTASTGAVNAYASWSDVFCDLHNWVSGLGDRVSLGRTNTPSITTATTTTVVDSPGASTVRRVDEVVVRNNHATDSNVTTIQHTDGTTVVKLWKGTLAASECVAYSNEKWTHYDADGYAITATGTTGATGAAGAAGADGQGVPTGGTTGQVLRKKSNTNYDTEWYTP